MTHRFQIGEEVQCIAPPDYTPRFVGLCGEVVDIEEDPDASLQICVSFYGTATWWCEKETLVPVAVLYGPPAPIWYVVQQKCKKLWNESNFVQEHPHLAY